MADDPWAAFRKPAAPEQTAPAPVAADDPWAAFRPKAATPEPAAPVAVETQPVAALGAGDGRAHGALNAAARGIVDGIPVLGPVVLGGIDRADSAVRALTSDTRYSDELAAAQRYGEQVKTEHPIASTVGEVGGAVAGTIPLVMAAPAAFGVGAAALPVRAGLSMATSGALGGADAAARSGGDVDATLKGAAIGAGAGLAAPFAGMAVGKAASAVASKIKPAEAIPAVSELKDAARAAYTRADEAGVQVAQPAFAAAITDMATAAREAGIDRTIHPKATAALARLEETAGTSPTLKDVELLRRIVKGAAGSIEPDEKRIALMLVDKLDDFTGNLKAGDLVSGDAATATDALGEARKLWGQAKRSDVIDDAVTRAENRAASTGSGGNTENAIRQNIRAILENPKKRAGFTEAEKVAMMAIVRGSPIQNAMRLAGKLSPAGNGLMAALGIGATAANPLMAALPAAGLIAKKVADRGTTQGVQRLGDLIRSGGNIPVSPLALPARQAVEPLAINIFSSAPRLANRGQQ